MSIEDLVKEFQALAAKGILSKAELEEAKDLMRKLKVAGFSNEQIAELSKGKWTSSTVKYYTVGVKPAHPTQWENAVAVLDDLIHAGMDLEDAETAVTVDQDLGAKGVKLGDVVDFLLAAGGASMDVATLVNLVKEAATAGLSPNNIKEVIKINGELIDKGLSLDSLPVLLKLAANFGEAPKVLEALSVYGSSKELEAKITTADNNLHEQKGKLDALNAEIEHTQLELNLLKKPIEAYEASFKLGFGLKELNDLTILASKSGGPKAVLKAFKAYKDHTEIMHQVAEAQQKLQATQSTISELETKWNHLKSSVEMCRMLIMDHQCGLDAISTILSAAKKFGQPLPMLKAIETYGSIQALLKEKAGLEGAVAELDGELKKLQGEHKKALDNLSSLNATALKVGMEVGKLQGELAASSYLQKLMELIVNPESAAYSEQIGNVLQMAVSLRKWAVAHEDKLKSIFNIKSGLESLIKALGGLP